MKRLICIMFLITIAFCLQTAYAELPIAAGKPAETAQRKMPSLPAVLEAQNHAILSADREGSLRVFNVDAGDKVQRGNLLGVIFHNDLILERKLYANTKRYWDKKVETLKALYASGTVADVELAQAVMEQASASNKIEMMDSKIEQSKLYAPFSGAIIKRYVRPYEWVKAGQPVLEIYNPAELSFSVSIPSNIMTKFKMGDVKSFFISDLNKNITAKLSKLEPQVEVHSRTVKTYWRIGNDKENVFLLPGMKGVMNFE